jgi:hypothetical protein
MLNAIVGRLLVALLALTLVGGTMFQFALPASASPAAHATPGHSTPCDHMGMVQQNAPAGQTMPCNSMPCKGSLGDCLQMCLVSWTSTAVAGMFNQPFAPVSTPASLWWPRVEIDAGQSVQPDPFPPKRLIPA